MSLVGKVMRKKNPHHQRPFSIDEKTREGRAATTTCETYEDRCCRICFDDKKKETPITPCKCKVRFC